MTMTIQRLVRLMLVVIWCMVPQSESSRTSNSPIRTLSTEFPALETTLEMARLSKLVYKLKHVDSCENATHTFENGTVVPIIPSDLTCHLYSNNIVGGTQVLVASSTLEKYTAIVFAGTDNIRTTLTDGDILLKPFGPLDSNGDAQWLPPEYKTTAKVHAGFDNAVFEYGLFDELLQLVQELRDKHPDYTLYTTGHSLGAANSILTAVGITLNRPEWKVTCINFGCPRTGNRAWREFVDSQNNLGIWRVVLGWDLIPRLPKITFVHVGHTIQLNSHHYEPAPDTVIAYYLHYGNETLGYAGVPVGWSSMPFIWVPGAFVSHSMTRYQLYLQNYDSTHPDAYIASEFCPMDNRTMDDDDIPDPPDGDLGDEEESSWFLSPQEQLA